MEQASLHPPFPLRVLVVDDCEDGRDVLCMLLRMWGYQAEPAADGPSALAAAPLFRPDLVLMDLAMPGMDGYEAARRLWELPQRPMLVAMTGYGQAEDLRKTHSAGFVAHVLKPAEPTELRALLGRVAGLLHLARVATAAGTTIARPRRIQASADGERKARSPQSAEPAPRPAQVVAATNPSAG